MVEVIKHGNLFSKSKCKKCGCEFYYTKSEIKTEYGQTTEDGFYPLTKDSRSVNEKRVCLYCPECRHMIILEKSKVEHWWD